MPEDSSNSAASASSGFGAPNGPQGTLLGHPKGLFVLFFTEMWERFSFYSMRAYLVLFMTKALAFGDQHSNEIYGSYLGFVYAAPFIGGMLADRLLGQRRAIVIGGCLMAAAQFTLAGHAFSIRDAGTVVTFNFLFFVALALLSAGNGFFKPNISTIVGSLYAQDDKRRDGAFFIFYMGINIGAFLAGFSGQIAEKLGWHWGFLLAGLGMVLGQIIFFAGRKHLHDKGLPPRAGVLRQTSRVGLPNGVLLIIGVVLFVPAAAWFISSPGIVQVISAVVALPIVVYLIWEARRGTREEFGRMISILVLCSFSMIFWAFFELAGSAMNLFTDRHVDRTIPIGGGQEWELTASLLTAQINPLLIVLLCIPFAKLWVWLDKKQMEPSSPLKFSLGLLQLAAGFLVFYFGAIAAGPDGVCHLSYLVLGFLLHTTGELCLSPVGLSTMTKLSPARFVGMFMGVWFLASSLGNVYGGMVGGMTEDHGFDKVFLGITITAAAASLLLLALTPKLKKMMHGVK